MSIEVRIPMKQILTKHGVEVTAELYGNFADALNELLRSQTDYDHVGVELHPQLMVKLPAYPYPRSAEIYGKYIQFRCGSGSTFAKYIHEYCGFHKIDFEVIS
jgi:hypothetical protein